MRQIFSFFIISLTTINVSKAQNMAQYPDAVTPIILSSNSAYNQDFNVMKPTPVKGLSNQLPEGWAFTETGSSANTTFRLGNGISASPDTYAFGLTQGNPDKAIGSFLGGGNFSTSSYGALFTNGTSKEIKSLEITYYGEHWRSGVSSSRSSGPDSLVFSYSLDAKSLNDGEWIRVKNLDFTSISNPGISSKDNVMNGNEDANRKKITATISVNIPKGAKFWIKWDDINIDGADDGLGVDDFSIIAK